jgi:tetratricopeptide (TPR) repeat protein
VEATGLTTLVRRFGFLKLGPAARLLALALGAILIVATILLVRGGPAAPIARWLGVRTNASQVHFLKARDAYTRGDLAEASSHLDRARRAGHPEPETARLRALIWFRLGRFAEAEPILIRHLSTSTAPDPEAGEALARIFLESYRLEHADRVIERWIRDAPRDGKPYLWLTEVDRRIRGERADLLEEHYRTALRLDPTLDRARLGLADLLLEQRRHDEAAREYAAHVARNPADATGHLGLGRVAMGRGDLADAARHLDRALERAPADPIALKERALVDARLGDDEAAVRRLTEAIKADALDTESLYHRSLALGRLGRTAEAEADSRTLKRLREDQAQVLKLRERLLEDPKNHEVRSELARWMFEHGRDEEGLRWVRHILAVDPRHRESNRLMAEYYERKGEPGRANYYRLMIESGP